MDSFFELTLMALAIVVGVALLPWIFYVGARVLSAAIGGVGEVIAESFDSANASLRGWQSRRSTFAAAQEILRGSRFRTSRRRGKNLEIYALAEVLRRSIHVCNEIHHFAADVLGVEQMDELEDHAVCAAFRARVIETLDVTLESLMKTDVSTDVTAAKMLLGLDRMRDVCADCQLLHGNRAGLPKLCDPAIHMGCTEEGAQK